MKILKMITRVLLNFGSVENGALFDSYMMLFVTQVEKLRQI